MRLARTAIAALCCSLLLTLFCVAAPAQSGAITRVNPDNSFDARFSGAAPRSGEIYTVKRDNEDVGTVIIRTSNASEASGAPVEGSLGRLRIGDQLSPQAAAHQTLPPGWVMWTCPEAGYRIAAPRRHETRTRAQKRGPLTVQEHVDMFVDDLQRQTYIVLWCEVPEDFLTNPEYARESDSVKEDLMKRDYRVTSNKSLSYEGMECLEQDVTLTDVFARQRVFLTSRRMYQILAVSQYREVTSRARTFFGTFGLYAVAGRPLKAAPARVARSRERNML